MNRKNLGMAIVGFFLIPFFMFKKRDIKKEIEKISEEADKIKEKILKRKKNQIRIENFVE